MSLKVQNKLVLEGWLPSLGLTFSYDDNVVIIRAMKDDEKKLYVIEGKVVDDNNIPMPGVTVLLDSTLKSVRQRIRRDVLRCLYLEKRGVWYFLLLVLKLRKLIVLRGNRLS